MREGETETARGETQRQREDWGQAEKKAEEAESSEGLGQAGCGDMPSSPWSAGAGAPLLEGLSECHKDHF